MSSLTGFRLVQGFYWLSLGSWFGAMLMLVIAATVTFKTVRAHQVTLGAEPYNHPAFAQQADGILAGGIVGNVLKGLGRLQIICAAAVVLAVVLQCTVFADRIPGGVLGAGNLIRVLLILIPVGVLVVDQAVITPRVWEHRAVMYDPDQSEQARTEARAQFDRYHKLNERIVGTAMLLLAVSVIASAFVLHGDTTVAGAAGATTASAPPGSRP